jgi:hypothetical protein
MRDEATEEALKELKQEEALRTEREKKAATGLKELELLHPTIQSLVQKPE